MDDEDKRELNFNDSQIKYLPELINFTNLHSLYCSNNDLIFLPTLPPRLEILVCNSNRLISLPVLPENLKNLYCFSNLLLNLPTLPENLTTLDCKDNYIEILPTLPVNLSMLDCSTNRLILLPALPETLIYLQCNENCLTSLPHLPESLKLLHCEENALTGLPRWPKNLSMAFLNFNPLVMLPDLLPVNLTHLNFFNTPLFKIIESCDISVIKKKLHTLHRFRGIFHALKCKRPLRKLLWEKVRGPKLEKLYHPEVLKVLLSGVSDDDDEEKFHEVLDNWK